MLKTRAPRAGLLLATTCLAATGIASASIPPVQTEAVDPSIRPGEDFYRYANNAWLSATQLPEGASRIDTTAQLRAENVRRVRALVSERITNPVTPTDQKIADYYLTLTDSAAIEAKGLTPIAADLAEVAAIADRRALASWLGRTVSLDDGYNQQTQSVFGVWIHQGYQDPDRYAAHLVQGGLGLGDRDAYLDASADAVTKRAAYRARIASALKLAGFDRPEDRAGGILNLEIAIAGTHAPRSHTDDVFKIDNEWQRSDFAARAPGLDWDVYFDAAGLDAAPSFVVWQPSAVTGSARLVATQPLDVWKDYLAFHLIDHYAAVLPRAAGGAAPDAFNATEAVFGDAIGQLYVDRYFPPRAKAAAETMVDNIRAAFRTRLANSTWMASETKSKALAKLDALKVGLGYPSAWVDYSPLAVIRGDAFGNLKRAEAFAYAREIAKLRSAVDANEWPRYLHPHKVSAVLNLSPNSMQFTAGLLQPPYFDADGDTAANYGSAGAGLAHEVSHSFDEVGNIYDAQGRLGHWWSEGDFARYKAASALLASQLAACAAAPGLYARASKILGESTADIAGLAVAYDAYRLSLQSKPDSVKNGLTGDQRFFAAFAQRWRRLQTDASLRTQVETDNHAPPSCRSGLVRNIDPWVKAFDVKAGAPLFLPPGDRIRVW
ncbi:M13 family metallopeptidase [Allosphingosinicella vermicomposti]|uniref:M13 family metallopeptidase n=1 Tax=Allosphingosinicella vermicomposti TaxID=614671 RepID=UPI000D0F5D41|nr:M13 family metallopeptidase [Allosphingosinicella vermicomposti]